MALYFLEKSPTYVKRIDVGMRRRREAVCHNLNDVYKVPKFQDDKVYEKVVQELADEGIEISNVQYQSDKVALRSAYLWLMEKDEQKKDEMARRESPSKAVIKSLKEDNLLSWDDLTKEEPPQPEAEEQAAETPLAPGPKLAAHEAGKEVANNISSLFTSLEGLLAENDYLREDCQGLRNQHDDYETYLAFVENENAVLQARLDEAKQGMRHVHSIALEELAAEYPEFPELSAIAQRLKKGPGRRQDNVSKLMALLPKSFSWPNNNGAMVYEQHFLEALAELRPEEQEQVIKQIGCLANEGPEYHSLHTVKCEMRLPFSPAGCFKSRGAETLRFTWKKNSSVHIHWLYRKGDSRVRETEA